MRPIGVYVHFPWCLKKCPYCDFVSYAKERPHIPSAEYADAVVAELVARLPSVRGYSLQSVFFGGGTPSLWDSSELGRVLKQILEAFGDPQEVEVTVECNPTSLDEAKARELAEAGVNRLSIGVQSLDAERLQFLGRLHDQAGAEGAVDAAVRLGRLRVSADLIYGVATERRSQSAEDAVLEASRFANKGITHLSLYNLTIEPGTQFGELARRGRLPMHAEEEMVRTFFALDESLTALGYDHYEISNYAKAGHRSQHNLGYWNGVDYLGLGCGAFGTLTFSGGAGARYRNQVDPAKYMRAVLDGEDPEVDREALDSEARMRERIMLGLRLREGFDLAKASEETGAPMWTACREAAVEKLVCAGKVSLEGTILRVPKDAWIWADSIASSLF